VLELLSQEGVDLEVAGVICLNDVVLVPLEFGQLLYGSTDIAQTFRSGLGVFIDSLYRAHAQFRYQSAQQNSKKVKIYPLLS
jgi:hypothetical protein